MKTIYAENTHGIIKRVQGSVFAYQGWPTVARDENGTLYAVISGFCLQHSSGALIMSFGRPVRLRFIMRDAKLYSMQFV